ncbi:hypothetical protein HK405_013170, partial [Cladochytrium tenue]
SVPPPSAPSTWPRAATTTTCSWPYARYRTPRPAAAGAGATPLHLRRVIRGPGVRLRRRQPHLLVALRSRKRRSCPS